jgi:hypothetical protein
METPQSASADANGAVTPLDNAGAVRDDLLAGWPSSLSPVSQPITMPRRTSPRRDPSAATVTASVQPRPPVLEGALVDLVLGDPRLTHRRLLPWS